MIEALELNSEGTRYSGLTCGSSGDQPVLLLHGFPQTSRAWLPVIERLQGAGLRLIAPDQRGLEAGAHPAGTRDHTLQRAAADVTALADLCGADAFHLVGHDLGGIVAWELACRQPQRVLSLTAISTPHLAPFADAVLRPKVGQRVPPFELFRQPGVAEQILLADDSAVLRQAYAGLPDGAVSEYVRRFSAPGVMSAMLAYFRAFDFDSWLSLPAATVETLFAWGEEDPFLDPATALATREHVKGGYRAAPLDGVAHWVPELAAARLAGLLVDHFAGRPLST